MLVEEVMTDGIICVDVNTSVVDVALAMRDRNIGLVGVTENERLIGVLTDRDIITKLVAKRVLNLKEGIQMDVITIEKDKTLDEALVLMGEHRIKRLIITESTNPIGIVSISDILSSGYTKQLAETFRKIYGLEDK